MTFTPMTDAAVAALSQTINTLKGANLAVVGSDRSADGVKRAAALVDREITVIVDEAYGSGFVLMNDPDIKKIAPVVVSMADETDEEWYNRVWAAEDAADLADAIDETRDEPRDDESGDVWERMMEKYRG